MGGCRYSRKTTVEESTTLDIFTIRRLLRGITDKIYIQNGLKWSRNGETTGSINYRIIENGENRRFVFDYKTRDRGDDEWQEQDYSLPLVSTRPFLGGKRWWFICFCGRRVAKLYLGRTKFHCRHCLNLSYESRNENKRFRSGEFGLFAKMCDAEEKEGKLRVRYYRGKPTRRYQRLLRYLDIPTPDIDRLLYS